MSEVLKRLKESNDTIERELANVLEYWQKMKREKGDRASLGYEPRDINLHGARYVIATRVLNASIGFEEVDPQKSYEAIVLKYRDEFRPAVVQAAEQRIREGVSSLRKFEDQYFKFLIKTNVEKFFGEETDLKNQSSWIGKTVNLPELAKEGSGFVGFLEQPFNSLIWFNETPREGQRGGGFTAIARLLPTAAERQAVVSEVEIVSHPIGQEFLENSDSEFFHKFQSFRHNRIWPISENDASSLIEAQESKAKLITVYGSANGPTDNRGADGPEFGLTALREVKVRLQQHRFRNQLLSSRPNNCAITGTRDIEALEAAHIIPFSENTIGINSIENGILLRRDIHSLYDRHLISIDPFEMKVVVSERLVSSEYRGLQGKAVTDTPSLDSLNHHFDQFQKNGF